MRNPLIRAGLCLGLLAAGLSGCTFALSQPVARAAQAPAATAAPTATPPPTATAAPTPAVALEEGLTLIGAVMPAQDASLVFAAQGIVAQVLVREGDVVEQGQLLAALDTRALEQQVAQAQAVLDSALAARAALNDPPSAAAVAAAQAQVRQAEIARAQAAVAQPQTVEAARSAVTQAEIALQQTRDSLSSQKTQAEQRMFQASEALVQAQAAYSEAYWNEQFVEETGDNPANPKTTLPNGQTVDNELADTQKLPYETQLAQAEAALRSAEQAVAQAQVAYDEARLAEVTGIQQGEQAVVQAQANLNKLLLASDSDQVAAAQVGVDQAQANLDRLYPSPTRSDLARASASVRQAEAALEGARIALANAELRAPFAGTVGQVNISPGDSSAPGGAPPIYLLDAGTLHVDVAVSDVDIGRVRLGQRATMSADGAPEAQYRGAVSYISPSAAVSGNVRTYTVRLSVDDPAGLRPGMSIKVTFAADGSAAAGGSNR